jgi:hypothetical protein
MEYGHETETGCWRPANSGEAKHQNQAAHTIGTWHTQVGTFKAYSRQNRKDGDYWYAKKEDSPNRVFYIRTRRKLCEIAMKPKRNPKENYPDNN